MKPRSSNGSQHGIHLLCGLPSVWDSLRQLLLGGTVRLWYDKKMQRRKLLTWMKRVEIQEQRWVAGSRLRLSIFVFYEEPSAPPETGRCTVFVAACKKRGASVWGWEAGRCMAAARPHAGGCCTAAEGRLQLPAASTISLAFVFG